MPSHKPKHTKHSHPKAVDDSPTPVDEVSGAGSSASAGSKHRAGLTRARIAVYGIAALVILLGGTGSYVALRGGTTTTTVAPAKVKTVPLVPPAITNSFSVVPTTRLSTGPLFSSAIQQENARPGTSAWHLGGPSPTTSSFINGYASATSVAVDGSFSLFVDDSSNSYHVEAYRMGYYQGLGARLIWTSPVVNAPTQPACILEPITNMVNCANWTASMSITTSSSWVPGDYLLKLVSSTNEQSYIPLTVVDYSSNAAVLIVNAVTTWQAYNPFERWDLYIGPYAPYRSTVVTFDRPYGYGNGAADFLGNELPLVTFAERLGLNVTYLTDVDIDLHPQLMLNHSEVVSPGHDEYWSPTMRTGLTAARDAGVNIAFMGANAIFRRIRFSSSVNGPDRIEANYRIASLDPEYGVNNSLVTTNWPSGPDPQPEGDLIGVQYQCNPVDYPMVITDPTSWVFANTGLTMGSKIPNLIGSEFDGYGGGIGYSPPSNVELLANSPVLCRNVPYFSDMSYYTASSGAGVFDSGTSLFVASVGAACVPPLSGQCPIAPMVQVMTNILEDFGSGPAASRYPAHANAAQVSAHPPYGPLAPVTTTTTTTTSTTTTLPTPGVTGTTAHGGTGTTTPAGPPAD